MEPALPQTHAAVHLDGLEALVKQVRCMTCISLSNNNLIATIVFFQMLMNVSPAMETAPISVPTQQDPMSAHVRRGILWQMMVLPVMVSIII